MEERGGEERGEGGRKGEEEKRTGLLMKFKLCGTTVFSSPTTCFTHIPCSTAAPFYLLAQTMRLSCGSDPLSAIDSPQKTFLSYHFHNHFSNFQSQIYWDLHSFTGEI